MSKDGRPVEGPVIEYRDDEARYRATFQQAAIGIVHTAPDGAILDVNPAFCLMLGYERGDLILTGLNELLASPDEAGAAPTRVALGPAAPSVRE